MKLETALSQARALVATLEAIDVTEAPPPPPYVASPTVVASRPLAWGARVSAVFRDRVFWIAEDLGLNADHLMTCMAWESGRSFRSDVRNMAGSGATGLIQFMPATALPYFHSAEAIKRMTAAQRLANGRAACDRLAAMTAEDQLNYVWRYFAPYKGRLRNLGDVYMAILWPGGVGQTDAYVLWEKGSRPTTYRQNAGLDANKDGRITRAETVAKVAALLPEGLAEGNVWRAA